MSKKTYRDNYRVEALVPTPRFSTASHDEMMRRAKELKAQVDRHCDTDHSQIDFDTTHQCSTCGSAWVEDSDAYNGGCCDEDEKANPAFPPAPSKNHLQESK